MLQRIVCDELDIRYATADDVHSSYKLKCLNWLPFRMEFGLCPGSYKNRPKKNISASSDSMYIRNDQAVDCHAQSKQIYIIIHTDNR